MADSTKAKLDTSGWTAALAKLAGPARESLARSMAVAGGEVLRDEAKVLAPVQSGGLRDSIYLAYQDGKSTPAEVHYAVSWNGSKAPHGHLIEFGHWQTHEMYQKDGKWYVGAKLANPKWVSAKPFLRPAFESANARAQQAMIERGRARLPELLAGSQP
jgi:HK97 gp10 family phage protein